MRFLDSDRHTALSTIAVMRSDNINDRWNHRPVSEDTSLNHGLWYGRPAQDMPSVEPADQSMGAGRGLEITDGFDFLKRPNLETSVFNTADRQPSNGFPEIEADDTIHAPATASAITEGRNTPDTPVLTDADPQSPPPPIAQPQDSEAPTNMGRPAGATPGPPQATPQSPEPGDNNADYGRPADAVPDLPPDTGVLDDYTSGGQSSTSYNVSIDFLGSWTVELQTAFIDSAEYLSTIILADLPDVVINGVNIDDIIITATLEGIDGVGGVLGSAGPDYIRNDGSYLTATGSMTFDSEDAQNQLNLGNWETIVLHEMIHALGFGTLWTLMGLTTGTVAGGDIRFAGINATDVYQTEFASIANGDSGSLSGVPVETDGGQGTAGGHWDEILFGTEIMTGYVDPGGFVSQMTIAALEDMGYDTVYDNPYSATDLSGPIPVDPLLDLIA